MDGMTPAHTPEPLSFEDLAPDEASALLSKIFSANLYVAEDLYEALSAWTWSSLASRRNDAELREWLRLFKAAQVRLASHGEPAISERVRALCDLLYRSVRTSEHASEDELLSKRHVKDLLVLLHAEGGGAPRKTVLQRTGLLQPNLTRIAIMMENAGLLTRRTHGREVEFELTRHGYGVAEALAREAPKGRAGATRTPNRAAPSPAHPVSVEEAAAALRQAVEAFRSHMGAAVAHIGPEWVARHHIRTGELLGLGYAKARPVASHKGFNKAYFIEEPRTQTFDKASRSLERLS